jgi:RNA polymerase sigma factor (sigma-70 family)
MKSLARDNGIAVSSALHRPRVDLIPTRQSLLSRLRRHGDQESWSDFFNTYWRFIYYAGLRSGLTKEESEDVVQETILSVTKNISSFNYDPAKGSFKAWLMKTTRWRIDDQFRKRLPPQVVRFEDLKEVSGFDAMEHLDGTCTGSFETIWNDEWDNNLLEVALENVKSKVDPKHFQVFDLSAIQKLPIPRVAKLLKFNRARIYLIRHRIYRLLAKELQELKDKTL